MRALTATALTCVVALACGTQGRPAADTAAAKAVAPPARPRDAAAAPSRAATPPAAADACRKWGDWEICSVEDRLARAGLVIERDEKPVRHEFLSIPGVRYKVHNAQVEVFVYATAAARAADTDRLDTLTVSPPGKPIVWPEPATLVTSANLAAIILSVNARQSERIALALGAGLPQHPP